MLTPSSLAFLKRLLDTPGPSGYEAAAAAVWRAGTCRAVAAPTDFTLR